MRMDGFPALAIHGGKSQGERDYVLAEFKNGNTPIMIATGNISLYIFLRVIIHFYGRCCCSWY